MFHLPQPAFYKGEVIPSLVAQDGWNGDQTSYTINFPALSQEGDMAIASVISEFQSTLAVPTGWTQIGSQVLYSGRRHAWFRKIVEAGEPGTGDNTNIGQTVRTVTVTSCVRNHSGNFDAGTVKQGPATATTFIDFNSNSRTVDGDLYTAVVLFGNVDAGQVTVFGNDVPDGQFQETGVADAEHVSTAGVVFKGTSFNPNNWQLSAARDYTARTFLVW